GDVRRTIVPLDQISPYIREASVSIEDAEFYNHNGVRVTSMIRALISDIFHLGYAQGGSTIDQQVIKNTVLTNDKTITRKVKEIILSLKLDSALPKDKILEIYLNNNPYGGTIYGVEEASEEYFGVHANAVDLAQAAYLAALPQAPTYYSPYGNHRGALEARKNLVLDRMLALGYITQAEYDSAKAETVAFEPAAVGGIRAPHFVFFVRSLLEQEYGEDTVRDSGWHIITSLDADLEQKAEDTVKQYALQNEKQFNASNAAIVSIDPKSGDILTMAGSRDYFDTKIEGAYNIALANRQPGSAFKPFVYAEAFLKGYTPDTILFDVPTQFSTACAPSDMSNTSPCYSPSDFDGKFDGPMTIRDALAQSRNVPAVKALYLVGLNDSLSLARAMGITTLGDAKQYGLTLVLGGGEVTLLDMTSAYSVFADDGVRNPYRAILRIEDKDGNIVKQYPTAPERVLDAGVSENITDILADNVARTPELGADSPLNFPGYEVAAKTGTTNNFRDAWVLGYTPSITVGAWAGNNNNTPMVKKIAGFIVAPMWHSFVQYALTKYPPDPFPQAPSLENDSQNPVLRGVWNQNGMVHTILYYIDRLNPTGPPPANPASDPQYSRWEYGVEQWAAAHPMALPADTSTPPDQGGVATSSPSGLFQIFPPVSGNP
ncbi:MAG: transglycosylase domain-containing protein, partial [Patescibacteria group bacterium]|nr:transglycosylase domain-containing protein [Patescibacteria group bacterium]